MSSYDDGPNGPRHRYRNDIQFSQVVDMMRAVLHKFALSPSEMREALMLAVVMEEMTKPHLYITRMREFADQLIKDQTRDDATDEYVPPTVRR